MATFSTDVGVEPTYIDIIDIGAGYGVLSVPVDGFFPGDLVQLATLTIQPSAGGSPVITEAVDLVQRTQGFFQYQTQTSISAHFSLTAANIATIAGGAFSYAVVVTILRNGISYSRQVQIGTIAAMAGSVPPPLIVASLVITGGPVTGAVGQTTPLVATAYDGIGHVIPGAVIAWSSSNPLIAQPDQSGLVSFLMPGAAAIIASSQGILANTMATTVDPTFVAPTNKQVAGYLTSDSMWRPRSLDATWIQPGTFADDSGHNPYIFPNEVRSPLFTGSGAGLTNLPAGGVTGIVTVVHGGTGLATVAAGNLLIGAGTSVMVPLAPGGAAGFVRSDGSTWARAAIVTADVSDLTSAATGITKLGTINTGTWQGTSIATTYTDAKIKTVTGTSNRLTVGGTATDPTFDVSTAYVGQATITTLGTVATGTWQAGVIAVAYTAAQIVSVTGTSNRVTIGGTSTNPTFDIAATYVGQSSITTLGTIATGVWNASVISTTYTSAQLIDVAGTSSRIVIGGTSTHPTVDISSAYVGQGTITTLGTITAGVWNGTAIADGFITSLSVSKLTGSTLPVSIITSSLTTVGTIGTGVWQGTAVANAYIASGLDVAKLTVGTTLPSNVVTSSLTTVGTIGAGTWQGSIVAPAYGGTGVNNATATITLGGSFATSGAFTTILTVTGNTTLTLPTSGTLVTSAVTVLSSLISVGTITTGVWNATPIVNAYIASGIDVAKITVGATLPSNVTGSSLTSVGTIAAGTWQGTSIATTYTDAKIKTVTGTANRLTVAGTATDPTFDVSTSYVGQASIVTLGTVTTGVWAATTIAATAGGTGQTTYALGDTLYSPNTNALGKLAGNTTAVKQYLSQTGTGVVSAAPAWATLVAADISDLATATTGITKVGTITTGTWHAGVIDPTYGGTGVNNGASTITLGGSVTHSGAFTTTFTVTGTTSVTLPTSGTLVNTAVTTLSSLTTVGILASTHLTAPVVDSGGLTITAGNVAIGTALDAGSALIVGSTGLTGTSQRAGYFGATFGSGATTAGKGVLIAVATAAASYTMATLYNIHVNNASKGAASAITTQYGFYVDSLTSGASNYAIYTNAGLVNFGDNVTMQGTLAVTGIVTGGTYNGQTISSAASFTGTLAVTGVLTANGVSRALGSGGAAGTAAAWRFGDSNSGGSRDWAISNGIGAGGAAIGALVFSQSTALNGDPLAAGAEIFRLSAGGGLLTVGDLEIVAGNVLLDPSGTNARNILINGSGSFAGKLLLQAGGGSGAFGGAINLYGHSHATHPGDVVAAVSSGSGGSFRVNSSGLDAGTNWLTVNATAATILGQVRAASLGVGNSATATVAVGVLANKIQVFDASGSSLGYLPVYASIT